MKRRAMLLTTFGTVATAFTGATIWTRQYIRGTFTVDELVAEIRRQFSYLELTSSNEDLREFVNEYLKRNGTIQRSRSELRVLVAGGTSKNEYLRSMLKHFLLSTDFFQNRADITKPVIFLSYYDPVVDLCMNPLIVNP